MPFEVSYSTTRVHISRRHHITVFDHFHSARPSHSGGFLGRHGESSCRREEMVQFVFRSQCRSPTLLHRFSQKGAGKCFSIPSISTGRKSFNEGEATERDKAYNASQDLWN